jgi:hypothetical protein
LYEAFSESAQGGATAGTLMGRRIVKSVGGN